MLLPIPALAAAGHSWMLPNPGSVPHWLEAVPRLQPGSGGQGGAVAIQARLHNWAGASPSGSVGQIQWFSRLNLAYRLYASGPWSWAFYFAMLLLYLSASFWCCSKWESLIFLRWCSRWEGVLVSEPSWVLISASPSSLYACLLMQLQGLLAAIGSIWAVP